MSVTIKDNTEEVLSALDAAIDVGLEGIGIKASGYAALNLEANPRRIDTGNLRNSITYKVQDRAAYIGTNVSYAIYVHDGTSRMEPNRFLTNAAQDHMDEYKAIIQTALEEQQ